MIKEIKSWYISLIILCITIFPLILNVLYFFFYDNNSIILISIGMLIFYISLLGKLHIDSCIKQDKFIYTHTKTINITPIKNSKED